MAKKESKGMNLPNKITCVRLIVSVIVLVILCLPWDKTPWKFMIKSYSIFGVEFVKPKYIIAGVLFLIGSVTDFLELEARKVLLQHHGQVKLKRFV